MPNQMIRLERSPRAITHAYIIFQHASFDQKTFGVNLARCKRA